MGDTAPPQQRRTGTKRMLAVRAEQTLIDDVEALRKLHGRRGITRSAYVLLAVGRQVRADKELFGVNARRRSDAT